MMGRWIGSSLVSVLIVWTLPSSNAWISPLDSGEFPRLRKLALESASTNLVDRLQHALQPSNDDEESNLPILHVLPQIHDYLTKKERPNGVLQAPPGAGKTTLVPLKYLLSSLEDNDNTNRIVMIEPRRVAARGAARRMADLLQEQVGKTIGYAMRGEAKWSPSQTRILVVTEGVFLQELQSNPELDGISAVIVDEFHERSVAMDTSVALARGCQRHLRPDLQILVMSATLSLDIGTESGPGNEESSASKILNALGGNEVCWTCVSQGRQYPVEMQWNSQLGFRILPLNALRRDRRALVDAMCSAIQVGLKRAPDQGDVLAFLPGAAEIRQVVRKLEDSLPSNILVLPFFGALPKDQQDLAIFGNNDPQRRVIVASPIAEASVTLPRVTCVVDSGLRRQPQCDVDTGIPRLITVPASWAAVQQRAGRAGRVQPGLCIRLFAENEPLKDQAPPEMLLTDLTPTLLLLADWGCSSLAEIQSDLPFVDPPPTESLERSMTLLNQLGILQVSNDDPDFKRFTVTPAGRRIASYPAHPRLAACLDQAIEKESTEQLLAVLVASYILDDQVNAVGKRQVSLIDDVQAILCDAFKRDLLRFASRFHAKCSRAVDQFVAGKVELNAVVRSLGAALLPGYIDLTAERKGDASYGGSQYLLSLGRSARLDDMNDGPQYMLVVETSTGDDGKTRIRCYVPLEKELLLQEATEKEVSFTVASAGHAIRSRRVLSVGSLELESLPLPNPSEETKVKVFKKTIKSFGAGVAELISLQGSDRAELQEYRARVRFASKLLASKSVEVPAIFAALDAAEVGQANKEQSILLEEAIEPWLAGISALKEVKLKVVLQSYMPEFQETLDELFPAHTNAPDGSLVAISYLSGEPRIRAKLQQFFGCEESPRIGPADARIPVGLSLLSPSGKPLAETKDLAFFWKEVYQSVRSEMRGRYNKHPWPEDPIAANPTRQTNKQLRKNEGGNRATYDGSKKKARGKKKASR